MCGGRWGSERIDIVALRVFSYGGGVQSTAALVLAGQGKIDYPVFLFANVGNDSEHPDTLRYVEEVAKPYAVAHGIELIEVQRMRKGQKLTLYSEMQRDDRKGVDIPIRHADTGKPMNRQCTKHFKVLVIGKWTKAHGATLDAPALVGLGISIDEYQRMNTRSFVDWHVNEYPLIDLRLSRNLCREIIASAGLPQPRKSACWFCPFTARRDWMAMRAERPDLFMNAVVLEQDILARRRREGQIPAYLTQWGRALPDVIGEQAMLPLDDDDTCESGFCMT